MHVDTLHPQLEALFQQHPVQLAYLFGSQATGGTYAETGVLLYCPNDETRVDFQVRALCAYEDTAPLRNLLAEAMVERLKAGTFGKPMLLQRH